MGITKIHTIIEKEDVKMKFKINTKVENYGTGKQQTRKNGK